jgi:hypothetical protein
MLIQAAVNFIPLLALPRLCSAGSVSPIVMTARHVCNVRRFRYRRWVMGLFIVLACACAGRREQTVLFLFRAESLAESASSSPSSSSSPWLKAKPLG